MSLKTRTMYATASVAVSSGTNTREFIVVHETDNTRATAGADNHARLQFNGNSRAASWHWQVDDKEAIKSFAHNKICWHAGNSVGNAKSIGVEICVNSDSNFKKAVDNAAQLVAKIMKEEGIPLSKVVQHHYWSGKNCPRNLRSGAKGINWKQFIGLVEKYTKGASNVSSGSSKPSKPSTGANTSGTSKSVSTMAQEVLNGTHGNGHEERRKSLGIDKATYEKVRAEVNRILGGGKTSSKPKPKPKKTIAQMADEVIAGKHGSGHANRQKSLGVNNATYAKVRAEVNKRSGVSTKPKGSKPAGKSISQMATEVIAGKHGNGHTNRRKSLGVSQATYDKVRAEVNRRS